MTEQPDALRLADALETLSPLERDAAAELRRLHSVNAQLLENVASNLAAIEAEREACAKVCDEMEASGALSSLEKYRTRFIADAIRARGQE
jgi:hypothetical protein